jgi:hypothetical protein
LEKIQENEKLSNENPKKEVREVFFKFAPLLDPFKYLIGKYDIKDERLYSLPNLQSTEENTTKKMMNPDNAAYIDSFFLYLNSLLIHKFGFIHGVDYYGTFLSIKNNYQMNVFDDLEYLIQSDFFIKNKNVLFHIDYYEHLMEDTSENNDDNESVNSKTKKQKLIIDSENLESNIDFLVEDLLQDETMDAQIGSSSSSLLTNENMMECNDLFVNDLTNNDHNITFKSHSSCSSRTSHTESMNDFSENGNQMKIKNENENDIENDDNEENDDNCNSEDTVQNIDDNDDNDDNDDSDNYETVSEDDDNEDDFIEEKINVTFPKFPVQVICMENCLNTLDDLIINDELNEEQWFSALMQVIMILITFQKVFSFTHNDLHTNNIMYIETDQKFLYYCFEGVYYKVPTFGRIFKIIDFGRSIYHYDGKLFCSDSFEEGGDASTQYNTEPYFNNKKPRIEPNYSFDLCRLACSIFDYVVNDFQQIKDLDNCTKITRLIVEWCLDDKGVNVLYKNNGDERYPDFKLYKMIARCVHNHTPEAQLKREVFKKYIIAQKQISSKVFVMNIDNLSNFL